MDSDFAEQATGVKPPRSFILDASVLAMREEHEIVREDVKRNRIVFEFPDGLEKVDLADECRALATLDDFDTMYDLTMQKLVGKSVYVWMKQDNGSMASVCQFHVSDRYQNLRAVSVIDENPVIVNWLVEFIGALMLKQYPTPINDQPPRRASEASPAAARRKRASTAAL